MGKILHERGFNKEERAAVQSRAAMQDGGWTAGDALSVRSILQRLNSVYRNL